MDKLSSTAAFSISKDDGFPLALPIVFVRKEKIVGNFSYITLFLFLSRPLVAIFVVFWVFH